MSKVFDSPQALLRKIVDLNLWHPKDHLLVAVSGGMDSMVLLHALVQLKSNVEVAHVNFGLRGQESDADEKLVRDYCRAHQIKVHVRQCTPADRTPSDQNTQLWARRVRYEWFEQLRHTHGLHYILTAHHQDDQVETVLYRLSRGSGLKGIAGMRIRDGYLCRPLLHFSKIDLKDFATKWNIPYRHDASNDSLNYDRNYIRHEIVPLFQKINPTFSKRLTQNTQHWQMAADVLEDLLQEKLQQRLQESQGQSLYHWNPEDDRARTILLLRLWLTPLGFTSDQIEKVAVALMAGSAGQRFEVGCWKLATNRKTAHLSQVSSQNLEMSLLPGECLETRSGKISIEIVEGDSIHQTGVPGNDTARLDYDKIDLPIGVRNWKPGDFFYPLGLGGKKKIKKYLREQKLSLWDKEDQLVCTTGGQICWIVGGQIDDRFKVNDDTNRILHIRLERQ